MSRKTVLVSGGNIWFPEASYLCLERQYWFQEEIFGSPKGVTCVSKDNIHFPKEIFGSPKGVICVSKDSIGFPKEIFRSPKGVSQIRIGVRQMMYVDQFEVFRCPNRSSMAAQRSETSGFSVGFSGGNSEQTAKQPKEVLSRKLRAHCLNAVPDYWSKIAKLCKQILFPV